MSARIAGLATTIKVQKLLGKKKEKQKPEIDGFCLRKKNYGIRRLQRHLLDFEKTPFIMSDSQVMKEQVQKKSSGDRPKGLNSSPSSRHLWRASNVKSDDEFGSLLDLKEVADKEIKRKARTITDFHNSILVFYFTLHLFYI